MPIHTSGLLWVNCLIEPDLVDQQEDGAHANTAEDLTSACPTPGCQTSPHGVTCFGL